MKKITLIIVLLLCIVSNIEAQKRKEMKVYKKGNVLHYGVLTPSDSIKFSKSESSRFFKHIQNGTVVKEIAISEIDSIKFHPDPDWVLINGVKWATRNVGTPKSFVSKPEDFGGYYQWNRDTTDFTLCPTTPYNCHPGGSASTWEEANDPSPAGFRVPTLAELQSLTNTTFVKYEWITRNGVRGGKFTDRSNGNCIFLPAAGYRGHYNDGVVYEVGSSGSYWSSTQNGSYNYSAYCLFFYIIVEGNNNGYHKSYGLKVRPVADF